MILFRYCLAAFATITVLTGAVSAQAPAPAPKQAQSTSVEKGTLLNINTATASDLEHLPGIGAKVAARIVEYRTKKGPFRKTEELMNVQGIGEKSFLKLRPQLTVGAPATSQQ